MNAHLHRRAHYELDSVIQSGRFSRAALYKMMAAWLDIPPERAHVAQLTDDQCREVLRFVESVAPDESSRQSRRSLNDSLLALKLP